MTIFLTNCQTIKTKTDDIVEKENKKLSRYIGKSSEDLQIDYKGDNIEIGFNSKYIMDIVNNLEDEEISIKLKDNSSPITAQENSNTKLVYVLMPMRG